MEMSDKGPMRILLIEDDKVDASMYTELARTRTDIQFVGITDSCAEAIKYVKTAMPEGVILDLQLIVGEGSGLAFMEALNEPNSFPVTPLVVVTTSNTSKSVFKRLEDLGVDWYFSKTSQEYNPSLVLDTLISLRPTLGAKQSEKMPDEEAVTFYISHSLVETPQEREKRIYARIEAELNSIGIRPKLLGRAYLKDAIFNKILKPDGRGSGIEETALLHKLTYSSVLKTMQVAINDAWDNGDPDALIGSFSARITAKNGVPYVSDFIHYFANKINNNL